MKNHKNSIPLPAESRLAVSTSWYSLARHRLSCCSSYLSGRLGALFTLVPSDWVSHQWGYVTPCILHHKGAVTYRLLTCFWTAKWWCHRPMLCLFIFFVASFHLILSAYTIAGGFSPCPPCNVYSHRIDASDYTSLYSNTISFNFACIT